MNAVTGPIGLYIHIPFCQTKCSYCNFNTYARLDSLVPAYVDALCTEINLWGERLGNPEVRTVFFGGGTPSWVPSDRLEQVLEQAKRAFRFQEGAECSAEVNPGDVSRESVARWMQMGLDRISMGLQSFDDTLLALLTRRHTAAQAIEAYHTLRDGGYQNVSFDLIYGLPRQSLDTWRRTLDTALALDPAHISMYALTVEEGTPLWTEVEKGAVDRPDPDLAADMYEAAEAVFGSAGYRHYEISNWAKPGFECRHNLVYWQNEPFLGVGPGAHSYMNKKRFWNVRSPSDYVRRLTQGHDPALGVPAVEGGEPVDPAHELSETLILALRLDGGADLPALEARFGHPAVGPHIRTLEDLMRSGLVTRDGPTYCLTARGRLLSNEVFVRLLPE